MNERLRYVIPRGRPGKGRWYWSRPGRKLHRRRNCRQARTRLRRTAMVRMAEAGATTPQIASVRGHSIEVTQRILETYLPRNRDLAEIAITRCDSSNNSTVGSSAAKARRNNPPCKSRGASSGVYLP